MSEVKFLPIYCLVLGPLALHASGPAVLECASAESMDRLMTTWTRTFSALHPETPAHISLKTKFSADAFDALLRGEVAIAPFARELFPAERARYLEKHGTAPLLVPVATGSRATKGGTHAIAIFVHERNPLARLSITQLREILSVDGAITTWGQLGLGGEWSQRKIALHGMSVRRETGNPPGIVNYLEHRVLDGRAWRGDASSVAHPDSTGGPQALEKIVRAVAADESALGYSGFAYAQAGTKTLALSETDAGPAFAGTTLEIARREYPLTRTIYLCLDQNPAPVAKEFVSHVLGQEAQQVVATDAQGFFPLTVATAGAVKIILRQTSPP